MQPRNKSTEFNNKKPDYSHYARSAIPANNHETSQPTPFRSPEIIHLTNLDDISNELMKKKARGKEFGLGMNMLVSFDGLIHADGSECRWIVQGGVPIYIDDAIKRYDKQTCKSKIDIEYIISPALHKRYISDQFTYKLSEGEDDVADSYYNALKLVFTCENNYIANYHLYTILSSNRIISDEQLKAGAKQFEQILKNPLLHYQQLLRARKIDKNFRFPLFANIFSEALTQLKSNIDRLDQQIGTSKLRLFGLIKSLEKIARAGFPYFKSFKLWGKIISEYICILQVSDSEDIDDCKKNIAGLCDTENFYLPLIGNISFQIMNILRCVPLRPIGGAISTDVSFDQYADATDSQDGLGLFNHDFDHAFFSHTEEQNWFVKHPEYQSNKLRAYRLWSLNYSKIDAFINKNYRDAKSHELAHAIITYLTHETMDGWPYPYDFELLITRLKSPADFYLANLFMRFMTEELSYIPDYEEVMNMQSALQGFFESQLKYKNLSISRHARLFQAVMSSKRLLSSDKVLDSLAGVEHAIMRSYI